jgi:hypothetical protein
MSVVGAAGAIAIAGGIGILIMYFVAGALFEELRPPAYRGGNETGAIVADEPVAKKTSTEEQLRAALATITDLRAKGKRVIAERDHWETLAKELTQQLAVKNQELTAQAREISELKQAVFELQKQLAALTGAGPADAKFAAAKREFAKMYHPNNNRFSGLEKLVRAELFREFWVVLERIDAGAAA